MPLIDEVVHRYYQVGAGQRLGQFFFNTYIKREDNSTNKLFHEGDFNKARTQIAKFMEDNQWNQLPKELVDYTPTATRLKEGPNDQ